MVAAAVGPNDPHRATSRREVLAGDDQCPAGRGGDMGVVLGGRSASEILGTLLWNHRAIWLRRDL